LGVKVAPYFSGEKVLQNVKPNQCFYKKRLAGPRLTAASALCGLGGLSWERENYDSN
jgi:hypothetical protein